MYIEGRFLPPHDASYDLQVRRGCAAVACVGQRVAARVRRLAMGHSWATPAWPAQGTWCRCMGPLVCCVLRGPEGCGASGVCQGAWGCSQACKPASHLAFKEGGSQSGGVCPCRRMARCMACTLAQPACNACDSDVRCPQMADDWIQDGVGTSTANSPPPPPAPCSATWRAAQSRTRRQKQRPLLPALVPPPTSAATLCMTAGQALTPIQPHRFHR